jgi:hypothetical protein
MGQKHHWALEPRDLGLNPGLVAKDLGASGSFKLAAQFLFQ